VSSVRAALRLRVVSATPARLEPRRDAMQLATVPRRPKAWGPVRPIAPALWGDSLLPGAFLRFRCLRTCRSWVDWTPTNPESNP